MKNLDSFLTVCLAVTGVGFIWQTYQLSQERKLRGVGEVGEIGDALEVGLTPDQQFAMLQCAKKYPKGSSALAQCQQKVKNAAADKQFARLQKNIQDSPSNMAQWNCNKLDEAIHYPAKYGMSSADVAKAKKQFEERCGIKFT